MSAIRDLALLDMDEIPNERARFLKHMPAVQERIEAQARLPQSVREMLEQVPVKKIAGAHETDPEEEIAKLWGVS